MAQRVEPIVENMNLHAPVLFELRLQCPAHTDAGMKTSPAASLRAVRVRSRRLSLSQATSVESDADGPKKNTPTLALTASVMEDDRKRDETNVKATIEAMKLQGDILPSDEELLQVMNQPG